MNQDLSPEELREAAQMIQGQSKRMHWCASYSNADSIWVGELESSDREVCVRYLKRHKQCMIPTAEDHPGGYSKLTFNQLDRQMLRKYGMIK